MTRLFFFRVWRSARFARISEQNLWLGRNLLARKSSELFEMFLSAFRSEAIEMTNANFEESSGLCGEFTFGLGRLNLRLKG
jgi:hypothetical protein